MKDLNKRLVEVETILKKLDENYINKIPTEIWDFIIPPNINRRWQGRVIYTVTFITRLKMQTMN